MNTILADLKITLQINPILPIMRREPSCLKVEGENLKVILALSLIIVLSACSTAHNRYAASEGQERESLEAPCKFVAINDGKMFYDGEGGE